jgi:hypothetical protein
MIVPGQSSEGLTGHKIRKFSFLYVWKESPWGVPDFVIRCILPPKAINASCILPQQKPHSVHYRYSWL